jgi:general secretion pathway protein G
MLLRDTQSKRRLAMRAAFTLMELLVVMAIIVIIAGFGGYYVLGRLDDAKITQAIMRAKSIAQALETYKLVEGEYPPNLEALLQPPNGRAPLLKNREEMFDPWGQQYQIDPAGQRGMAAGNTTALADVFTRMPSGAREISNWDKK